MVFVLVGLPCPLVATDGNGSDGGGTKIASLIKPCCRRPTAVLVALPGVTCACWTFSTITEYWEFDEVAAGIICGAVWLLISDKSDPFPDCRNLLNTLSRKLEPFLLNSL